ncbi:MAG: sodium:proton antiporter [Bacteroidota bacterium]
MQKIYSQHLEGSITSVLTTVRGIQADLPPTWLTLPFIILLLMIATGPLLYERFWHRHYPKVAILLAGFVAAYYCLVLHNFIKPVEALMEYVQFIALIVSLYMATGGVLVKLDKQATPTTNLGLLLTGAVLSNLIGTTGASMLLIRPYIRLNRGRVKVYHIVFFIFIVSNVGGALTPIGDPPLFLGFLKGVPFFWTLQHNLLPWLLALFLLSTIFLVLDTKNLAITEQPSADKNKPTLRILGKRNFVWLVIIIVAVFLDPHVFDWVPAIQYHGHSFSFAREVILFSVAGLSHHYASSPALQGNEFTLEPLKEVVLIFIGIFGTMIPALTLIGTFAQSQAGSAMITPSTLYWGAGVFSSILDNAPTYLNFGAASMAAQGADIVHITDVQAYALGGIFANSVLRLKAISIASVFFGAMTYIGNGPNFMVRAIAEHLSIRMPSFFGYIIRFSIPLLLPVLGLVWIIFFALA